MSNYVSKMTVGGSTALIKDSEARDLITKNTSDIAKNTENINNLNDHVKNKSNPHNVTAEQLGVSKTNIVDMIYPVGSIYMSVNNASPATLFGGTWVQIQDKFLLASGPNYTNGNTGGSDTHRLNANELPAHTHVIPEHAHDIGELNLYRIQIEQQDQVSAESPGLYINSQGSYITERGMVPYRAGTALSPGNEWVHTDSGQTEYAPATNTGSTGNGQAFSTMPPYLVVNVWQRTA